MLELIVARELPRFSGMLVLYPPFADSRGLAIDSAPNVNLGGFQSSTV
jgi:hypothetical protein